jgi:hypothetical protein
VILTGATLTVLVMLATGLVLFRRLARLLLAGDPAPPSEPEFLLLGILPGLALVGLLVTGLGMLHLLRLWILLPVVAAIFWALRRDANSVLAGLRESVTSIGISARRGDLLPLLALIAGIAALALGIHLCLMPSDIADVWSYHIPIAHSFITHHGIIAQPVAHPFYGNNPLLFELLFATAMLVVDHFAAAGIVNVAVYFGLMLLILSFARRARGFQFLLLLVALVWASPFFLLGAAQPMIDVPRSCLSVAAYLFAFRYAQHFRRFDLTMAALLAGAAVAGKYTELVTPLVICATLAPLMIPRRQTWEHLLPAALAFAAISSFWYLKNAILYGNPVYPFLFAHPGLSNAWMTSYMQDIGQPFDAVEKTYSRNLLTAQGWHDFGIALWGKFHSLIPAAILATLGLALPQRRRWMLWLWSVLLFVVWYVVMFNGRRWAISATLMLLATAFITWFWMVDLAVDRWSARPTSKGGRMAPLVLSGGVALVLLLGAINHLLMPRWVDAGLASTLGGPNSLARELAATRPGYTLYRYIAQHNIGKVLQPLSDTAEFEVSGYNDGHDNDWILPPGLLPATATGAPQFVRDNGIHYFIDSGRHVAPSTRGEVRDPVLGRAVIEYLKPGARLILRDPAGYRLYAIAPALR